MASSWFHLPDPGAVLVVNLLRPPAAAGQGGAVQDGARAVVGEAACGGRPANPDSGSGYAAASPAERALLGKGSGVRVSQDSDGPVRGWQGNPKEALAGPHRDHGAD
jgi:hypothetical protein